MSRHRIGSAAMVVGLVAILFPHQAAAQFTPVAGWDHHLFPSFVIATATIQPDAQEQAKAEQAGVRGDVQGLLGVQLKASADNVSAKVTISGDAIMESSSCTAVLPKEGEWYTICPPIKYKYALLARNRQSVPTPVAFRLELPGREAEEQTVTMTLHSINDCPRAIHGEDDETDDIHYTFAAYVNEEHPLVDQLTKEALQTGIVSSFHGYSDDGPEEVLRQVFALWQVLSRRGVRYSDASTPVADAESVASQRVRLLEDSVENAQANCVDGSVLFASLLRKIGLEPFLVLEPTHCYVGFYLDEDQKQPVGLETTLLGARADADDSREIQSVPGIEDADWAQQESWATFAAAINLATEALEENRAKFEEDDDIDYQCISITAARQAGILPIPYTPSKEP